MTSANDAAQALGRVRNQEFAGDAIKRLREAFDLAQDDFIIYAHIKEMHSKPWIISGSPPHDCIPCSIWRASHRPLLPSLSCPKSTSLTYPQASMTIYSGLRSRNAMRGLCSSSKALSKAQLAHLQKAEHLSARRQLEQQVEILHGCMLRGNKRMVDQALSQ
jgi:hypothetical protein